MVLIFFFGLLTYFLLRIFAFFRPTIVDQLKLQEAIFVKFISLTFDRVFKPDFKKFHREFLC